MADRSRQSASNESVRRVLGVDTALRSSGIGVVEYRGNRMRAIEWGCIQTRPKLPVSECLSRLLQGLAEIMDRTDPTELSIEGGFFFRNARTAMVLGQSRGVVIAMGASRGLPVYEYAPRRVKQAIVGYGQADKVQVRRMIMSMLGLQDEPQEDAGDALALAVCHLHSTGRVAALASKPI